MLCSMRRLVPRLAVRPLVQVRHRRQARAGGPEGSARAGGPEGSARAGGPEGSARAEDTLQPKLVKDKPEVVNHIKDLQRQVEVVSPLVTDVEEVKSVHGEEESDARRYSVPRYTKVAGWDKSSADLRWLGRLLTSKRSRGESEVHVLEGSRLIREAVQLGIVPTVVVFSRVKLLWELGLPAGLPPSCQLYHVPYTNIKLWTDLSTSPGVMAAVPKASVEEVAAANPLPVTLVCDGVRGPDNLGAMVRVAAAVGARQVICVGCTDVWASKAVRAGAGAHFHVPLVQGVAWGEVRELLRDPWSQVVIADIPGGPVAEEVAEEVAEGEVERRVAELEEKLVKGVESKEEVMEEYKRLAPPSSDYSGFRLGAGYKEVVVVGGETEGVSGEAYRLCHLLGGSRLHIPLRNNVNSLNVISATSVIMFKIQQALLEMEVAQNKIT